MRPCAQPVEPLELVLVDAQEDILEDTENRALVERVAALLAEAPLLERLWTEP